MALKIHGAGKPRQEPRLRAVLIGGPGVGKTRWTSFFPKPIFADCEDGTGSIMDRGDDVAVAEINGSQDMLDLLGLLQRDNAKPKEQREYQTVVIDTLDAYQRKLKDEWVRVEKKPTFTGYDAWGFLQNKMSLLTTRLLNLDMNVIVNVHYKDKIIKEGENERHTYGLLLQGEIGDTLFNDFGLVGWMGTYFEAEGGERVQKRGLTFKPTPDKPFLKDRLAIIEKAWNPVSLDGPESIGFLFEGLQRRMSGVGEAKELTEAPTVNPDVNVDLVVKPEDRAATPTPSTTPAEIPLESMDKPTLMKLARDAGIQVRGNMIKSELVTALKQAKAQPAPAPAAATPAEPTEPAAVTTPEPETPAVEDIKLTVVPSDTVNGTEEVDTATGVIEPAATPARVTHDAAVENVTQALNATVVAESGAPSPAPEAAAESTDLGPCDDCAKPIPVKEADYVKISRVRYQPPKPRAVKNGLCKACLYARKSAA